MVASECAGADRSSTRIGIGISVIPRMTHDVCITEKRMLEEPSTSILDSRTAIYRSSVAVASSNEKAMIGIIEAPYPLEIELVAVTGGGPSRARRCFN